MALIKTMRLFNVMLLAGCMIMSASGAARAAQVPVKPAPTPPTILSDLKNTNPSTRRESANQLGALRARDAVRALIAALADKDATVREAVAFALGQIAATTATDPLLRVLADKDAETRASAAFALGMIGDRKAIPALSKALDDSDAAVRSSATAALGLMQDEQGVDEIIEMLGDASFDARYDAAWALGQIGEPDADGPLRASLAELDALRIPDGLREAFRQAIQYSLENLRTEEKAAPAASTRPRRATGVIEESKRYSNATRPASVRKQVQPATTERAARARVSGAVGLRVLVGADGRPARAYVTRRLGYGLDQRAVETILQYRFDPALQSGLPQSSWVDMEVKF
ncbi:MAG TPA: TonB family protein [Blastocatellia bacterium]|jgi:TonB family protein|nr:TonB family protein [Blastocatellia bacterium]